MDLLRMVQWKGEAMELYGFTLEVAQQTESAKYMWDPGTDIF